jgi:hypothetical protein
VLNQEYLSTKPQARISQEKHSFSERYAKIALFNPKIIIPFLVFLFKMDYSLRVFQDLTKTGNQE